MAGPGDVSRQMRASEAAQQARNSLAIAENKARLEEARRRRALNPAERRRLELSERRRGQRPDDDENKMLPGPGGDPHRRPPLAPQDPPAPPASDPLKDVPFASPQARTAAVEAGLLAVDFAGQTPDSDNGFTAAQVRAIIGSDDKS